MAYRKAIDKVSISMTDAGILSTNGSLVLIRDSESEKDTKTFMVDDGGHRVEQYYLCKEGTCQYPSSQPGFRTRDLKNRGRDENGQTIVLTPEELARDEQSSLEKGALQLDVRPAAQVDAQTWANGTAYWFEPDKADPFYGLLCELAQDDNIALVGVMRVRTNDKLFRVRSFQGGIAVQEILRPQDVRTFKAPAVKVTDKDRAVGKQLLESLVEDFDPDAYASERVAYMRDLIASKAADPNAVAPKPKKASEAKAEPELTSALEAALLAAKAKKAG